MNKYLTLLLVISLACVINADQRLVTKEFDSQVFNNDQVKGWSVSGNKQGRLISVCEKETLFGGFDVFGQGAKASKTFNSGVSHYELEISFELFALDSWDDEVFSLKLDDVQIYTYSTQFNKKPPQGSRIINCGSANWPDKHVQVAITVPHSSRRFTLSMTSTLNQDANDESWGIRNLQIIANYAGNNSQIISQEFSADNFVENQSGWVISPALLNPFSNCGKDRIFGGYNLFGAKTQISKSFSNLPEHWGIVIDVTLWFIDSVDQNNFVYVTVDGQRYRYTRTDFNFGANHICGSANWGENVQQLSIFFPHAEPTATISFHDDFDQGKDDESWGIQNLVITAMTGGSDKQTLAVNEFSDNKFTSAPGWKTFQGQDVSNRISTCAGATLFGGYNQLSREDVAKEYKNLPLHTNVRIFFKLFAIDSWDNEGFFILVDNVRTTPQVTPLFVDSDMCGGSQWKDRVKNYFIDIPHVGASLKLAFQSDLDQNADDESYGIRDLKIWTYVGARTKIISNEFDDYALWSAGAWSVKPDVNPKLTNCGPYQLFGGYNTFGAKTLASRRYENVPEHNKITVSFKIFFIDTWDKEQLIISIDGKEIGSATKGQTWEGQEHLCGWDASKEEIYTLQFTTQHLGAAGSSFDLSIGDRLDQAKGDESWGMRDLVISVSNSSEYEDNDACVVIYSECDYKGKKLTVCQNIADLSAAGWTEPIRSIQVPKNVRSRVFDQVNYQGGSYQALSDVRCIVGAAFVQINSAFGIQVSEEATDGTKLRKQH